MAILDYQRPPGGHSPKIWPEFRRWTKRAALVILGVAVAYAAGNAALRMSWRASANSYREPPDRVVFEEDRDRSHDLREPPGGPPDEPAYFREDAGSAVYQPKRFFSICDHLHLSRQFIWHKGLVVLHKLRCGKGESRLVLIGAGAEHIDFQAFHVGDVLITSEIYIGDSSAVDGAKLRLPAELGVRRVFAAQFDDKDLSHFTIKYEIDDKPGTIDGWLQADDTVKLQIRDGPALAAAQPAP